jgi:hypothetical protein
LCDKEGHSPLFVASWKGQCDGWVSLFTTYIDIYTRTK